VLVVTFSCINEVHKHRVAVTNKSHGLTLYYYYSMPMFAFIIPYDNQLAIRIAIINNKNMI